MTAANSIGRYVFLRACAIDSADAWNKDATLLERLDDADWRAVEALAERHGLTGLVARGLSHAVRPGLQIPVLERMHRVRRAQLIQHLERRAAARRVGESLTARGIRFVLFKGIVLAEDVYGDLSLRAFGDLDVIVRPGDVREAALAVEALGYRLPPRVEIQDMMRGGCHAAILSHADGTKVDLHWVLADDLSAPGDQEVIWAESRAAPPQSDLPGQRFSAEMTLVLLAAHYRHHAYESFKPLVDFMLAERLGKHDAARLASLAEGLKIERLLGLCTELSRNLFSAPQRPHAHVRVSSAGVWLARKMLSEESLPYAGPQSRLMVWLRCFFVNVGVGGAWQTARLMLLPRKAELAILFKRAFSVSMYPRYYAWRLFQIVSGCRRHLTSMLQRRVH